MTRKEIKEKAEAIWVNRNPSEISSFNPEKMPLLKHLWKVLIMQEICLKRTLKK